MKETRGASSSSDDEQLSCSNAAGPLFAFKYDWLDEVSWLLVKHLADLWWWLINGMLIN